MGRVSDAGSLRDGAAFHPETNALNLWIIPLVTRVVLTLGENPINRLRMRRQSFRAQCHELLIGQWLRSRRPLPVRVIHPGIALFVSLTALDFVDCVIRDR